MTFHVGQKVVYVGGLFFRPDAPGGNPVLNEVYTISAISFIEEYHCVHIDLVECPMPETPQWYGGYDARGFRPVVEPKVEVSFTIGAPLDSERWDNRRRKKTPLEIVNDAMRQIGQVRA